VADWRAALAGLDECPVALIYCAALVAIVVLVFARPGGRRVGYRRGRFLSANEKSFLRALDVALGRDYRPFAQVRLADLAPGLSDRLRLRALGGVMAKRVDFVICDGLSLDPVAAIEVDDLSHLLPERPSRDDSSMRSSPRSGRRSAGEDAAILSRRGIERSLRARRPPRRPSTRRSNVMRLTMLAGLAAGAVAIFAPEQGSSLTAIIGIGE
jgi:hypothetical protein